MSPKGPHFIFLYFARDWTFKKSQRVPPFTFFGTMRLNDDFKKVSKNNSVNLFPIFFHFDIVLLLLDKKIRKCSAFIFFWNFAAEWTLKNTKRSPFQFFFGIVRYFFIFFTKGSPFNFFDDLRQKGWKMSKRSPGAPIRSNFWVFGCFRREYVDTLSPFAIFEP